MIITQGVRDATNMTVYGLPVSGNPSGSAALQSLVPFYLGYGSSILNSNHSCNLGSRDFQNALGNFTQLYLNTTLQMSPYPNDTDLEISELMYTGRAIHEFTGSWEYYNLIDHPNSLWAGNETRMLEDIGFAVLPKFPRGRFTFLGGSGWAIWKNSTQKDLAWKFLTHLIEPTDSPYWPDLIENWGIMPAYSSLLALLDNSKEPVKSVLRSLPYAYPQTFPTLDFIEMGEIEVNEPTCLPSLILRQRENVISKMIFDINSGSPLQNATNEACFKINKILADAQKQEAPVPPDPTIMVLAMSIGLIVIVASLVLLLYYRIRKRNRDLKKLLKDNENSKMAPIEDMINKSGRSPMGRALGILSELVDLAWLDPIAIGKIQAIKQELSSRDVYVPLIQVSPADDDATQWVLNTMLGTQKGKGDTFLKQRRKSRGGASQTSVGSISLHIPSIEGQKFSPEQNKLIMEAMERSSSLTFDTLSFNDITKGICIVFSSDIFRAFIVLPGLLSLPEAQPAANYGYRGPHNGAMAAKDRKHVPCPSISQFQPCMRCGKRVFLTN